MSQIVAINGDCETVPAPNFTPAGIIYTDVAKTTVGGTKVIREASCVFTETIPPFRVDNVTLTPGATKLTDASNNVLRVGDTKTGSFGNVLRVKTTITNKLKSA